MSEIAKVGSSVVVPTTLIDQLRNMAKSVDASVAGAPQLPTPGPTPRPTPGPVITT